MTPRQNSLYWRLWSRACHQQGWTTRQGHNTESITALRHQAHVEALGFAKSSRDLTNSDFDLVKAKFELLINDANVDAAIRLSDPEVGERKRLTHRILQQAPEAYRARVSRDKFATDDLDDLSISQLNQLRNTLAVRARKFRTVRTPKNDNIPF